ncbi:ankyrin repeat-containing domain protein [Diplogelasinospora grovesii]|uniref:Ankyrin repeat-containing domain protein n=1 Tax=Diplogelasinospora grovesii TaxID=303347 RepID=A0AAN6RY68_9PEZI|nr:ankyrin repeat-containing domain protein [Diplogelasinospora grovesii]
MEVHRKRWSCEMCDEICHSLRKMEAHLRERHSERVQPGQVVALAQRLGRPLEKVGAASCPLCDYKAVIERRTGSINASDQPPELTPKAFGKHVARHLEQLALFVLPWQDLDGGGGGDDGMADSDDTSESSPDEESDVGEEEMQRQAADVDILEILAAEAALEPAVANVFPDLAMRWQPPHDFTPPEEDFDTDDPDLFPLRQVPLYGGDLFTPGWARGPGAWHEGYCARCPTGHWFHMTYLHGVPSTGVPLPRPLTIIENLGEGQPWKGYCEACKSWQMLKKTNRGWSCYHHWLEDHSGIVRSRTEAPPQATHSGEENPVLLDIQREIEQESVFTVAILLERAEEVSGMLHELQMTGDTATLWETLNAPSAASGKRPLMIAASNGSEAVVRVLLDYGADPNMKTEKGETALDFAANAGFFRLAQILLQRGADESEARVFQSILENDTHNHQKSPGTSRQLNSSETKKTPGDLGIIPTKLPPLSRLSYEGNEKAILQLFDQDAGATGSFPGATGYEIEEGTDGELGLTPFLLAFLQGHHNVMILLRERGANIDATTKKGWTALMLAAKSNDGGSVRTLLALGANVNHLSPDRWTALAEAASRGHNRIVQLLLEAGADTESRSRHVWTPLMHAAYRGDIECVNLLLSEGGAAAATASGSARDKTPMLLACAQGSLEVVKRLVEAGCDIEPDWAKPAYNRSQVDDNEDQAETTKFVVERAYQVGWTPLMLACQSGSKAIVKLLLGKGASMAPRSPMFKTALEIAGENGRTDIVKLLKQRTGHATAEAPLIAGGDLNGSVVSV